jgi:2-keto-3-deoxy-galactonokinase
LVIGTEINHVRALTQVGSRVALLAAPGLQSRYECALAFFDFAPTAFDVRALNADGFRQLMRSRS